MKDPIPLHILLIDNYDSFSYNLVELLRGYEFVKVTILKNDNLSIFRDNYDAVVVSPGPGLPEESAFLMEAIEFYTGKIPIMGICLGLQAICLHQGAKLSQLESVFHGIKGKIVRSSKTESVLLDNVPDVFFAGRYHSWIVDRESLPNHLTVTATDSFDQVMSIEDTTQDIYAVQFHPESYMTEEGVKILGNFITLSRDRKAVRTSARNPIGYAFFK